MDVQINRGPNKKCTAPNSSERIAVSSCKTALNCRYPVAKPCALSAHTLQRAGEVLTCDTRNKRTKKQSIETPRCERSEQRAKFQFRKRTFVCLNTFFLATENPKNTDFLFEGIIPPLPQPYGRYHNTTHGSNSQYFSRKIL